MQGKEVIKMRYNKQPEVIVGIWGMRRNTDGLPIRLAGNILNDPNFIFGYRGNSASGLEIPSGGSAVEVPAEPVKDVKSPVAKPAKA